MTPEEASNYATGYIDRYGSALLALRALVDGYDYPPPAEVMIALLAKAMIEMDDRFGGPMPPHA